MKGQPQGFGSQGIPPWFGMANQYLGGSGYGGYGAGQTGQQGNPYSQPPMSVDFSHGAGLYQPNQAQPYYAGGQPPPPPQAPGPPQQVGPSDTGALAPGAAGGYGPPPTNTGLLGSAGSGGTGTSGLLTAGQPPGSQPQPQQQPTWFNRGYGMPAGQQGGIVPQGGVAGGNMFPPGMQQYLSGLFGGGYR